VRLDHLLSRVCTKVNCPHLSAVNEEEQESVCQQRGLK
jgi:hypothetical protein